MTIKLDGAKNVLVYKHLKREYNGVNKLFGVQLLDKKGWRIQTFNLESLINLSAREIAKSAEIKNLEYKKIIRGEYGNVIALYLSLRGEDFGLFASRYPEVRNKLIQEID